MTPILYREVLAFSAITRTGLSAWEVELIMRVDDAVLAALKPAVSPASPGAVGAPDPAPASKTQRIREMFRGISAGRRKDEP